MAMIDNLVGKLVRKGQLTVVFANGSERSFGPGGEPSLRVRMADRRVAFDSTVESQQLSLHPSQTPICFYVTGASRSEAGLSDIARRFLCR